MSQFFINTDKDTKERFDRARFFAYANDDNYDPLTSAFADDLTKLPESGKYTVVGEEGRPDTLAYSIYGDSQYWWILLLYNKKIVYSDITTGETISYPSISDIEGLYFSLKQKETASA